MFGRRDGSVLLGGERRIWRRLLVRKRRLLVGLPTRRFLMACEAWRRMDGVGEEREVMSEGGDDGGEVDMSGFVLLVEHAPRRRKMGEAREVWSHELLHQVMSGLARWST